MAKIKILNSLDYINSFHQIIESNLKKFFKIILITQFIFLIISILFTWANPSNTYESSIFFSSPIIFWLGIFSTRIFGLFLVIFSLKNPFNKSNIIYGLIFIILSYILCLSLIIIRNYYMWCMNNDPATHISWINDILIHGNVPNSLIYPFIHILTVEINLISNINNQYLHKYIPLFFSILSILFIYIFSTIISEKKSESIIAVIISSSFCIGWYLNFTPNHLAISFFPLVLYLIFKFLIQKKSFWGFILFIIIIIHPIFHPVSMIFLGILLLFLWIPIAVIKIFNNRNDNENFISPLNFKSLLPFLLVFLIWSTNWITLNWFFNRLISNFFNLLMGKEEISRFSTLANQISYAQELGFNIFELGLKQYGCLIILSFISMIAIVLIVKDYKKNNKNEYLLSLIGPTMIICIIIPLLHFFDFGFGPLRLLVFISIVSIFYSSYFFDKIITISNYKNIRHFLNLFIILFFIILFFIGLLNLFPSPYNYNANYQNTFSEITGLNFFFKNKEKSTPFVYITLSPYRMSGFLLNQTERENQKIPRSLSQDVKEKLWHFSYDKYPSINYILENNYLITISKDKLLYQETYPKIAQYRYESEDFLRLNFDKGIKKIYINGGFDLWVIK